MSGRHARHILWLGEAACEDAAVAGGKAAGLSRLVVSHRVPPGFCLAATAFENAASGGRAGPATTEVDAPPALPPDVRDELIAAYRVLGERCGDAEPAVAVRSSAPEEDGRAASFAGQYETFLNVRGELPLAAAAARCWKSALAPRVLEYRRQRGLPTGDSRLAVLVQQLVVADVSAVVFSADPVTGDRDSVVITAAWGLGESLVGGSVTPDTHVVRKADLAVVTSRIAEKRRMTVAIADGAGGTAECEVPRFLRRRPCLSEADVTEMARMVIAMERSTGWPVDAECALAAGDLYLLQCRPVTVVGRPR
jgi:pyruvate,water dikinase